MKKSFIVFLTVLTLMFTAALQAVEVKFKISAGVNLAPVNDYFLAVQRYNSVPDKDFVIIRKQAIPEEQMPVVMFISSKAKVAPIVIMNMRRQGKIWAAIAMAFGIGPEDFYVPVDGPVYGNTYGRLYSYYNRPMRTWRDIRLSDDDVVNFVNLRFMCDHYGYRPDEVIRMRDSGRSFVDINREFYADKDRRAHGWKDANNNWHDRDKKWKATDSSWNKRENYWKTNDNRWHGSNDKQAQEKMNKQNYDDNQRWHGKYKESNFNGNNRQDNKQINNNDGRDNNRNDRKSYGNDDRNSNNRNNGRDNASGNNRNNNGNNSRGNNSSQDQAKTPVAAPTAVPTAAPEQDNTHNDKRGHDNGKGNGYQNNGRGNNQ